MSQSAAGWIFLAIALSCATVGGVNAQPTCTGACVPTFFDSSTAVICDYVDVFITGAGASGSLVGTSVFTTTSDMQTAAVFMGLVAEGDTAVLRLYWAGTRDYFFKGSAFGISSSSQVSPPEYGVFLTNLTTCPGGLMDPKTTPLRHLVGQPDSGGVEGFGYYPLTVDVFSVVLHAGWLQQVGYYQRLDDDLFAHEISPKTYFANGNHNGVVTASSVYTLPERAFVITNSPLPPTDDDAANRTFVKMTMPWTISWSPVVTGTTYVRYDSELLMAAYLGGVCELGARQVGVWIHWIGVRPVFYPSLTRLEGPAVSSDVPEQAIYLSRDPTPNIVPGIVPVDMTVQSVLMAGAILQGTGIYSFDSDVVLAAFHAGLVNMEMPPRRVYIYDLGIQPYFLSSTHLMVTSLSSNTPRLGYTLSPLLSTNINNVTALQVLLQFNFISPSIGAMTTTGTGYYRWDSDVALAAFHGGWLQPGEVKRLWIVPLGLRPRFYGSTMRGISSLPADAPDFAYTFSTDGPDLPAAHSDPQGSFLVNITSSAPQNAIGIGYYAFSSDIAAAAVHAGFLQPQETITLRVSPIGNRQIFLSARLRSITSVFLNQWVPAYQLSYPEDYIIGTSKEMRDVSLGATPFNITFDCHFACMVYGVGVHAGASDVKASAFMDGLINIGETREIWVHPLPVVPLFYPPARYLEEFDGYSALGTDHNFGYVLSASSITPPAVALAGQNILQASIMSIASVYAQLNGVVLYHRNSDVGRAAYHSGTLQDLGVRQTVYIHLLPTLIPAFYGCTNNSITSNGISSGGPDYGYRLSLSSAPLPPIDPTNYSAVLTHTSLGGGITGTAFYTVWSDISRAAHHSRLLHWGEMKRVWILLLPSMMTNFYASTSGSSASLSYFGSAKAFMLTLTPNNISSWPNETALKVTTILNKRLSATVCFGAGTYGETSDLTIAAFHNNIIPAYNVLTTFYVFKTTRFGRLVGAINRGMSCTSHVGTAGFILSTNSTRPVNVTIGKVIQVATVTIAPSSRFSTCYGTGYYYYGSFLDCAAVHQHLVTFGETATIYVFDLGIISTYFGSRGGGGVLSASLNLDHYGFSVALDNVTAPPNITNPLSMNITLREFPIGEPLVGFGWYSQETSITAAAFHAGLIKYNETKLIYVRRVLKDRSYSATSLGLTSGSQNTIGWSFVGPGYTFSCIVLSLSPAVPSPNILTSPGPFGLITAVSPNGYLDGHTMFSIITDVAVAALTMNLIRMNETKMIYVNPINGLPALPRCGLANNNGGHVLTPISPWVSMPSYYVATVFNASSYTIPTKGVPMNITAFRPRPVDDGGYTYGTGVYTLKSDLCLAAVHSGLVKWGQTRLIYAHYITSFPAFYGSSRNGITTDYYGGASDGWILSLSATTPAMPDYMNFSFTMYQQSAPSILTTLVGTGRYSIDSNLGLAAVHAGFYRWGDPPLQLWLKRLTSFPSFYPSSASNGLLSAAASSSQAAFFLSTSTSALPACLTSASSIYWSLPTGSITRQHRVIASDVTAPITFHYTSELTRSLRFAGVTTSWGYGERRTVKMTSSSGTYNYGAYTANGVATMGLGTVTAATYQVAEDSTCDASFPFPKAAAVTATGTLCEGGTPCVTALFPAGTSTAVGTVAGPFIVVGDTEGNIVGTTYYSKTDLVPETAVVHAGLLRAGEVGVFYATWLGPSSTAVYASFNHGVQTVGADPGAYLVTFSTTSAPVVATPGITPFNCTPAFTPNSPTGYRVFSANVGVEYAAQMMELVEVGYSWRMLYIHTVSSRTKFYGNQVNNRRSFGSTTLNQPGYVVTDSADAPEYVDSPLRITFNVYQGSNQPPCTGVQYWRMDSNLVCAAIIDGYLTALPSSQGSAGNDTVTLYVWSIPNQAAYLSTAWNGWSSDADTLTALEGFTFTPTNITPVLNASYVRVKVSGEMSWRRTLNEWVTAVVGIRDYYGIWNSFVSYAAMHQGLVRLGDPASIHTIYVVPMGMKSTLHSVFLNGMQSACQTPSTAAAGPFPVFAISWDPILDPKAPDGYGLYVTPYTVLPSFYDRVGSAVQGASFYDTCSEVALTAKHRGYLRIGRLTFPVTIYMTIPINISGYRAIWYDNMPMSYYNGVQSMYSSAAQMVVGLKPFVADFWYESMSHFAVIFSTYYPSTVGWTGMNPAMCGSVDSGGAALQHFFVQFDGGRATHEMYFSQWKEPIVVTPGMTGATGIMSPSVGQGCGYASQLLPDKNGFASPGTGNGRIGNVTHLQGYRYAILAINLTLPEWGSPEWFGLWAWGFDLFGFTGDVTAAAYVMQLLNFGETKLFYIHLNNTQSTYTGMPSVGYRGVYTVDWDTSNPWMYRVLPTPTVPTYPISVRAGPVFGNALEPVKAGIDFYRGHISGTAVFDGVLKHQVNGWVVLYTQPMNDQNKVFVGGYRNGARTTQMSFGPSNPNGYQFCRQMLGSGGARQEPYLPPGKNSTLAFGTHPSQCVTPGPFNVSSFITQVDGILDMTAGGSNGITFFVSSVSSVITFDGLQRVPGGVFPPVALVGSDAHMPRNITAYIVALPMAYSYTMMGSRRSSYYAAFADDNFYKPLYWMSSVPPPDTLPLDSDVRKMNMTLSFDLALVTVVGVGVYVGFGAFVEYAAWFDGILNHFMDTSWVRLRSTGRGITL